MKTTTLPKWAMTLKEFIDNDDEISNDNGDNSNSK